MPDTVLVPGMATAIGSLPHRDADAAAALVLRCLPEFPAAPQLPMRTPLEGVVAQWARAIDGVDVERRRFAHAAPAVSTARAEIDTDVRRDRARRAAHLPRRRRRAAEAAAPGEGAVRRAADARRRARRGRRAGRRRVPARRAHGARVGARARGAGRDAPARTPRSCSASTSPRSCAGTRGTARAVERELRHRPPLDRARRARRASPRCTCAARAICASRSTPARSSSTSTSARSTSTTPSRSPGSSTAAAG